MSSIIIICRLLDLVISLCLVLDVYHPSQSGNIYKLDSYKILTCMYDNDVSKLYPFCARLNKCHTLHPYSQPHLLPSLLAPNFNFLCAYHTNIFRNLISHHTSYIILHSPMLHIHLIILFPKFGCYKLHPLLPPLTIISCSELHAIHRIPALYLLWSCSTTYLYPHVPPPHIPIPTTCSW